MRPNSLLDPGRPGTGYIEQWARTAGRLPVLGVDEAGRGCLAGPVVAAAVLLPAPYAIDSLDDSKVLSADTRDRLYDRIQARARAIGVGVVAAGTIDRTNILAAALEAMRIAVEQATERCDEPVGLVVVDGNQPIRGLAVPQKTWAKADHLSWNCAAASIVAKVTRDRMMVALDAEYPGYGFAVHKGYGTPAHLAAIAALGPCPQHRMSFAPLKARTTP
jgi:ribonuclease HII